MIVVTGASGQLGRAVVDDLLARVPAERLGVSVRDLDKVDDLRRRGVRVHRADFGDPASLATAFDGASTVLIVSPNVLGERARSLTGAAIAAAATAGVDRIVYTSHMGVSATSAFPPMREHAAAEAALRASGVPFTVLRNGFYASTVPRTLRDALATGELRVPADGAVAWTAHADLAAAAARVLLDGTDGATPPLTGPEAVRMDRIAELASRATGRTIRHVTVSDDEYRDDLLAAGVPAPVADLTTGMFVASRRGDFGPADPALATLLGRAPISIEDYLRDALRGHSAPVR